MTNFFIRLAKNKKIGKVLQDLILITSCQLSFLIVKLRKNSNNFYIDVLPKLGHF